MLQLFPFCAFPSHLRFLRLLLQQRECIQPRIFLSPASSMADEYSYTNHQKLAPYHNRTSPSKFPTHFLYKVMAILVFLAVLPLLQSQAPDFINQTLLTGSWELLHLIFVGIAVSYGLFSRRNDDENEKDSPASKIDNPQSYVSKFLQVSSVFDEEVESPSSSDENKVQTWSSLYHRNEPVVVLAEEHPSTTRVGEKPLLLPVRSLKSRVLDPDVVEKSGFESVTISGSNLKTSSKRFSEKLIGRKNEVVYDEDVLQSPIPRRSTSGRMDMKKEVNGPSMEESIAKAAEDMTTVRKKTLYKSPPPPPPPPPPLPLASNKSNFDFNNNGLSSKPINPDSGAEIKLKNRGDREAAIRGSRGIKKAETEEEEKFAEKVAMESEEEEEPDTEEEDEEDEEDMGKSIVENQNKGSLMQRDKTGGIAEKKESVCKSGGGDVDKQADEFIAKFREQIRLQRIESIKRSSSQLRKNTSK